MPVRRPTMPLSRRLGLATVAALLVSGCGATGPTEAPVSTPAPDPPPSVEPIGPRCAGWINAQGVDPTTPEQIENAIRYRQQMGLPSGLPFVREVACRRDANVDFAVPLTAAEIAEFERRGRSVDAIRGTVRNYTDQHPDEFGGTYVDNARGGLPTVLWTAHLLEHETAIRAKLRPDAPIAFRQVRWSEQDLRALQDRVVRNDEAWFKEIGASPQSVGVHISENAVVIGISSANPEAAALIVAHYGMPDGMIRVESDGTGAALLPSGTVKGVVVRRDGKPLANVGSLMIQEGSGGPPGWCGGGDIGFGVGNDGAFEYPCKVGVRVIQVIEIGEVLPHPVLGEARVEVPAGAVVFVQIVIDQAPQP